MSEAAEELCERSQTLDVLTDDDIQHIIKKDQDLKKYSQTIISAKKHIEEWYGEGPATDENAKRLLDMMIPEKHTTKTNDLEVPDNLAGTLAKKIIMQELRLTSAKAIIGFAEAEGIEGVTKEIAGLTKGIVEREYKRLDEYDKEETDDKKRTGKIYHSLDEVDALPDVQHSGEIKCFLNIEKIIGNHPQKFTVVVTKDGEKLLADQKPLLLPDGLDNTDGDGFATQPTRGFHEITEFDWLKTFEMIRDKIKEHVFLLDVEIYDILALHVMSTYFRECFTHYPYIALSANEINCGKTTTMQMLCWASYYGYVNTTPTPAVIYRRIDASKSVLGIDELDNALRDADLKGPLTGILNAAHTKGLPVDRCVGPDNKVEAFDPFGTKIFTHVDTIPNSIRSRSIEVSMIQAPKTVKLKRLKSAEGFRVFRDSMYFARLNYSKTIDENRDWVEENCGLSHRNLDIFTAILTVARIVGQDTYDNMRGWAKTYTIKQSGTFDNDWNVALVEVLVQNLDKKWTFLGQEISQDVIRKAWIEALEIRGVLGTKKDGTPQNPRVSHRLTGLGLEETKNKTQNQKHFYVSPKTMLSWVSRYGIWEETEASYLELVKLVSGGIDNNNNNNKTRTNAPSLPEFLAAASQITNLTNLNSLKKKGVQNGSKEHNNDTAATTKKEAESEPVITNSDATTTNPEKSTTNSEITERSDNPKTYNRMTNPYYFEQWLSHISYGGRRGFTEEQLKKNIGANHDIKLVQLFAELGWLKHRDEDTERWYISKEGGRLVRNTKYENKQFDRVIETIHADGEKSERPENSEKVCERSHSLATTKHDRMLLEWPEDGAGQYKPKDMDTLYELIEQELVEEAKAGGPYRATEKGRERIAELKEAEQ